MKFTNFAKTKVMQQNGNESLLFLSAKNICFHDFYRADANIVETPGFKMEYQLIYGQKNTLKWHIFVYKLVSVEFQEVSAVFGEFRYNVLPILLTS